jgi:hypothetical protein
MSGDYGDHDILSEETAEPDEPGPVEDITIAVHGGIPERRL